MSSDNDKQLSPEKAKKDESVSQTIQNQEKKVCFICGSHTTLIINIHEPRCGPNMIDVIIEKFKMRPMNDDKFLCYSCNNWLINWYTVQKKNNDSSHEDVQQTTSSTISTAITTNAPKLNAAKTSDVQRHFDTNEMIIVSDDDDEDVADENVDVNNVIQKLRNRLKKYLYYPNRDKQKGNDLNEWQAHPQITTTTTIIELNGSPDTHWKCKRCGKFTKRHLERSRHRTLCRNCRFSMRRSEKFKALHKSQSYHSRFNQYKKKPYISSSKDKRSETSKFNNRRKIFEKLQQLGTSIYYENEYKAKQQELNRRMTSTPMEMDTGTHKKQAWKQSSANESNEILMTFNTVLTEVFPIDELYNYYDRQNDQLSNSQTNFNIHEILRNVPKSLTITSVA